MADASIRDLNGDVLLAKLPSVKGKGLEVAGVVLGGIAHGVALPKAGCRSLVESLGHLLKAQLTCSSHGQHSRIPAP